MIKRFLDIVLSMLTLMVLWPIFLLIIILMFLRDGPPIIFSQQRIGLHGKPFFIFKFRTMDDASHSVSRQVTTESDVRINPLGRFLRKWKLDELPQIFNILKGEMSVVGPRPEVKKYVDVYPDQFREILKVRPGLTDYASIKFRNESEILCKSNNPEETYIDDILPKKIQLSKQYCEEHSILTDFKIIIRTIKAILCN